MPGNRPSAKAIVLVIVVFVLGGLVGGLGAIVYRQIRRADELPRRERILDRLSRELQLTSQQRGQVAVIFSAAHKKFVSVYRQSQSQAQPQYNAIRQDVHARIRAILTPAQQVKFDNFLKRLDAEHKIHPPPPPGSRRRER